MLIYGNGDRLSRDTGYVFSSQLSLIFIVSFAVYRRKTVTTSVHFFCSCIAPSVRVCIIPQHSRVPILTTFWGN